MEGAAKVCLLYLFMSQQVKGSTFSSVTFKQTSFNLSLLQNIQPRPVGDSASRIQCALECSLDRTCHGFGYRKLPDKECLLISTNESNETYDFEGFEYFLMAELPSHCGEVENTESGLELLQLADGQLLVGYCEQQVGGGGWLVFQRRFDGSEDFFRTWDEYKKGFGNLDSEFWLGNDYIHLMTRHDDQMLKIELEYDGVVAYADYSRFMVDSEADKYRLTVSGYSGGNPPGDSLSSTYSHSGMFFTTRDQDNDLHPTWNCATDNCYGGWWYRDCHMSDLNGLYGSTDPAKGINWYSWNNSFTISMASTRMMIKTKP